MNSRPIVSIVKVVEDDVEKALNESIDLLGGMEEVKGKTSVAIKPNLCGLKSSSSGATTDPRIVEAIIKKIRSFSSCKISIVETNNSHASADKTFKTLGYIDLEKKYSKVKCVNLSRDSRVRLSLDGEIFATVRVPETLIFSDYLINVAKLKTHVDYRYTGVLKNAYGLLLSSNRAQYHAFMDSALVDLNRIYKPDLSIIDANVGMEGFGPTDGTPKRVGAIIASKDSVAADTVGALTMGINPFSISYLKNAANKGIGRMTEIEIFGSNLRKVYTKFNFIPLKWYYLGRFSLRLQQFSRYCFNFARFLSLVRGVQSTVGFSTLKERVSYREMTRLTKDTIFRIDV